MDRRKTRDVLFFALQCAKDDRRAFADAVEEGSREYREALADVIAFETLQKRLFSTKRSQLEESLDGMMRVSIFDIKEFLEKNPEMFNHSEYCECSYCLRKVEEQSGDFEKDE